VVYYLRKFPDGFEGSYFREYVANYSEKNSLDILKLQTTGMTGFRRISRRI